MGSSKHTVARVNVESDDVSSAEEPIVADERIPVMNRETDSNEEDVANEIPAAD